MIVCIDFETYYDSEISLTRMNYTTYAARTEPMVVAVTGDVEFVTDDMDALRAIDWSQATVIGHNLLFDALILKKLGHVAARYVDTLSVMRLIFPNEKGGIEAAAARIGATAKDKGALVMAKGRTYAELSDDEAERFKAYCLNDARVSMEIYRRYWRFVRQDDRDAIDHTVKLWLKPQLALDADRLRQGVADKWRTVTELRAKWAVDGKEIADGELRSTAKFAAILKKLGAEPPVKHSEKQGKIVPTFAKSAPEVADWLNEYPMLGELLTLRQLATSNVLEKKTERLIDAVNVEGAIPVAYNFAGAFTGRFSGANAINMANLPRKGPVRESIMARPGHRLVVVDLGQIEARLTAWLAGESAMLEAFAAGKDIYCEMAEIIFGRPINGKDDPAERFVGKCAVLGLGYSMSANKFRLYVKASGRTITEELSASTVQAYRDACRNIVALWGGMKRAMSSLLVGERFVVNDKLKGDKGLLFLPSGRPLNYNPMKFDEVERAFYSGARKLHGGLMVENAVQAIARDLFVHQMLEMERAGIEIVMHTYDEFVAMAPESEADATLERMLKIARVPPPWAAGVPLAANGAHGIRYADCK